MNRERTENNEIIISVEDLKFLIKSKNLYFQHPVKLGDGIVPIHSFRQLIKIAEGDRDAEDWSTEFSEIFTYWDNDSNTPLFDIIVYKELFDGIHYILSNCSLFGMCWLSTNVLSTGMKNAIIEYNINVPDTNLLKYTENNFEKAMLGKDFVHG